MERCGPAPSSRKGARAARAGSPAGPNKVLRDGLADVEGAGKGRVGAIVDVNDVELPCITYGTAMTINTSFTSAADAIVIDPTRF